MISKAVKVAGEVTYEKGYWLKNLTLVYSDVTMGGWGGGWYPTPHPHFWKNLSGCQGGGGSEEKIRKGMV